LADNEKNYNYTVLYILTTTSHFSANTAYSATNAYSD